MNRAWNPLKIVWIVWTVLRGLTLIGPCFHCKRQVWPWQSKFRFGVTYYAPLERATGLAHERCFLAARSPSPASTRASGTT